MEYKIMTPIQVWQDYNEEEELELYRNENIIDKEYGFSTYTINAMNTDDGAVKAVVNVAQKIGRVATKAILIVQEYHREVDKEVIRSLAQEGYVVVVPDCSSIGQQYKTTFPDSLSYGAIDKAGEHIIKVCPTAKDTCQYLYSVITRRTITFITSELHINDIVLMGIGDATEVAMQVAGCDSRLKGLVCVNGSGYKEYLNLNKYGNKKELVIDEQLMCWLTGVAAVAYAKHISVPVLFAISSNSKQTDIDRLPNLLGLLKEKHSNIVITPRSSGSISYYAYKTIIKWMEQVFEKGILLQRPKIAINVSEGAVYAEVKADRSKDIKDVYVYYSVGEYDHQVRNWQKSECQTISKNQFIAKLDISQQSGPLFAFCDIIYKEEFSLSSMQTFVELEDLDIKPTEAISSRIVYEGSMGIDSFTEESEKAILLQNSIMVEKTPIGLKGVTSEYGELISYDIGRFGQYNKGRILQIDVYSNKDISLEIKLIVKKDDFVEEYSASSYMIAGSGAFTGHKFSSNDFKNTRMLPLEDWVDVKAIKICNKHVIIGKILFI